METPHNLDNLAHLDLPTFSTIGLILKIQHIKGNYVGRPMLYCDFVHSWQIRLNIHQCSHGSKSSKLIRVQYVSLMARPFSFERYGMA